ncbi:MAG: pyridoxamine 5'-phosphate oxidase family protein [Verrucomicrobia bacterium]|nr:pyridoxamine 5'-phosphate oxidase family protein [Verrucomicrobiota bacterium]
MRIPEKAKVLMEQGRTIGFATVSADGRPNCAPMLQYWWWSDDSLIVGDLFMKATRANVEATGQVSWCVWHDETGESYKFLGTAVYKTSGPEYDFANEDLHRKKPEKSFRGVVVVKVSEVYDAARSATAGTLVAKL